MNSAVSILPRPQHIPSGTSTPPAAMGLIIALAEGLLGRRPLHQLRPYLRPVALAQLTTCVDSGVVRRMHLGRIWTQMPTTRAVEAVVRLVHPTRALACTIRLDAGPRFWYCTDLAVLIPDSVTT